MKITKDDIYLDWDKIDDDIYDNLYIVKNKLFDRSFEVTACWDDDEERQIVNCFLGSYTSDNGICSADSFTKVEDYLKEYIATEINKILK